MTKTELAVVIAAQTGLSNARCYRALSAMEQQLLAEAVALRAVQWDAFGIFLPRHNVGQRTGKSFGGSTISYNNWKLVPKPELVSQAMFIEVAAQRAQLEVAQFEQVLTEFKAQVVRALRTGRNVYSHEWGSFKVGRRKARIYRADDGSISSRKPARFVVIFKSCEGGPHQKFKPVKGLVWGK